jgi:anti-sigma factor RsiW
MHGFADGELDLISNVAIEKHLQDCPLCNRVYQNHLALKSALTSDSLYFKSPANLQKRVRTALREASKDEPKPVMLSWRWLALATSLALIAVIIWSLAFTKSGPPADELLAQEIVSAHVRSLMANHLTDVPSSDQHTVKPWFDGKLDFSPTVTDLTAQGFPLIGGRLDYIGNRPVAALVYQRRQHLINLFIYPSTDGSDNRNKIAIRQGYNLIHWNRTGMNYWAVSDLNISELQEFAQAMQTPS